ncbi:MAG TPA: hypothetical protein VEW65_15600 [Chryseolinea sp.]|nr:hypothetical protein [Chryseolinea sp.]
MKPFIEVQKIRPFLSEMKKEDIQFLLRDASGKWSEQYFYVEYFDDFSVSSNLTIVVRAPSTDKIFPIDLSSVTGIKLNKYLSWQGHLHSEFEILHSNNVEYLKVPFNSL